MSEQIAGAKNEHFNLVSVLYHVLEGAIRYDEYVIDAEQSGDKNLTKSFQKPKRCQRSADRAEELLAQRIGNFVAR